jgi:hypothetical protein
MPSPVHLLTLLPTVLPALTPRTLLEPSTSLPTLCTTTRTSPFRKTVIRQPDRKRWRACMRESRLSWARLPHFLFEASVELCDGGALLT